MEIQITRIDKTLPLPEYKTSGAVAFDLVTRVKTVVPPHQVALIPSNLVIQIPQGHVLFLASRSSTPIKKGLLTPHGLGIIDQDYCGPHDELHAQVYNFTDQPITVARGERIIQAFIMPMPSITFKEIELATQASRGGFGSTG